MPALALTYLECPAAAMPYVGCNKLASAGALPAYKDKSMEISEPGHERVAAGVNGRERAASCPRAMHYAPAVRQTAMKIPYVCARLAQ